MSTQQEIYAADTENRPPMFNKENYVPWPSRLLRYAKSKPNGKLLVNSIKNGPHAKRMIHEPDDPNSVPLVAESTHEQTDDELTEKKVKQIEADDQAIQTILMGLPKDIYAAIDDHQSPLTYMQQPQTNNNYIPQLSFNMNDMQQPMPNPEDISDPTTAMNMALNPGIQIVRNTRLIVVPGIANQNANQNRNGNVVVARAKGNGNGNNANQVRCYNYRGMGHLARNCTVTLWRKDYAYLQTHLLIAQKEEAGIQL
nr:hypothetical protein [Tanacetum cinerariifolium]